MLVPTSHRTASYADTAADLPSVEVVFTRRRLKKQVLDALGAAAWQQAHETFGYRWTGTDTLTWGSPTDWIRIRMAVCLLDSPPAVDAVEQNRLTQYDALRQILNAIESPSLHRLEEAYSFRDALAVERFLDRHPQLIDLLIEAHAHVVKHFGPDVHVVLEVVVDPESDIGEQLFAYISTTLTPGEALDRLDRVDEEWFLNQLDVAGGLFNFNLEAA
jgi:hypothetical protein